MELQSGHGVQEFTSRPQQPFLPPENFSFTSNFPFPNINSQQIQHPQQNLQHHFPLLWQQEQHKQLQPQQFNNPLAFSSFRPGVDHQNGNILPHNLIVGSKFDSRASYRPAPSIVVSPQALRWQIEEDSVGKDRIWKGDSFGMGNQQFGKFQKIEEQVLPAPNCRPFGELGTICTSQPELEKQQSRSSGSASEIYETQPPRHDNGPSEVHMGGGGLGGGGGGGDAVRNKRKCSADCDAEIEEGEEEEEKLERQLNLMARFVERRLMAHQESLQERFMEVIERIDKERKEREESWRAEEAEKARAQVIARAEEQALASSREAVIVSYLEKITGQRIHLPARNPSPPALDLAAQPQPQSQAQHQQHCSGEWMGESSSGRGGGNSGRWPSGEVKALIRVRSELETRFQEAGLKAALWEEISLKMGTMGYHRSAKRCKEKWENINKYFRKTKDGNGKGGDLARKRARRLKTCSYFDQLDQHYARPAMAKPTLQLREIADTNVDCSPSPPNCYSHNNNVDSGSCEQRDGEENELLEAMLDLKSNGPHEFNPKKLDAKGTVFDNPESNILEKHEGQNPPVSGRGREEGVNDNNP